LASSSATPKSTRLFGPTTEEAVGQFQKTHGLKPTGIVDKRTAALINREGENLRPYNERLFVVKGHVYSNGQPMAQVPVRVFDQDLRHEQPVGKETRTGKDGSFEIQYD
jgi:peptidoglycan hydrolase-like protein with peptidoglycan-binding domain